MKVTDNGHIGDSSWKNGGLEFYQALFNAVSEGICVHRIVYDDSGKAVDYEIIDVNPAYEKILSISKKDAVGITGSILYGTGEAPFLDIYAKTAETGEPASFEIYWPPLETYFNVSAFYLEKGVFGTVFTDISERIKAEKSLEESEKLHRTLV